MIKKVLLTAAVLCSVECLMAQYYDFSAVSPSGQTLYYAISWYDSSATVTYQYRRSEAPYFDNMSGNLIIPDSVYWNENFKLPVMHIDSGCFRSTGITSVKIPHTIRSIAYNAFAKCTNLTTIYYNADSCSVGWSWSGWDYTDPYAGIFEGCNNVTSIVIGDSVRYVPPFLFYECTGLQTLTVGRSVQKFHCDALPYTPTNLTTLYFNATTCGFRHGGFNGEYLYHYWIGNNEYERYYKELSPFQDITSLTNVTIGDNVKGLYRHFFNECTGLTSVVIPDSITYMRDCFEYCTNLNSVTIGSLVEDMRGTFVGCNHLTTINVRAEYPPTCDDETFQNVPAYADIIVPCGTAYRYQLTDFWNTFSRITEDCNGIVDATTTNIQISCIDGRIVVRGAEGLKISVFDIMGRKVQNVSNTLPNGVYIIKIGQYDAQKVVMINK